MNGSFESAHAPTAARRADGKQQHRQAAQPQRHEREPDDRAHRRRRRRAARLREQDRHDAHAHGRIGEHAQRVGLPVLREPSQRQIGTAIAATQPTAFQ